MLHPLSVSLCECFDQQGLLNQMDVEEGTHCKELIADHFATLNSRNRYERQKEKSIPPYGDRMEAEQI